MHDPDELIDQKAAAKMLSLGTRTLESWRWRGEGPPHIRLSARAIRYRRGDIADWIKRCRVQSTHEARDADK